MAAKSFFGGAFFGGEFFNTPGPTTPPVPVLVTPSGGGGLISPHLTSLARTALMPGMRKMIESEDEAMLKVIVEAVTKDRLH